MRLSSDVLHDIVIRYIKISNLCIVECVKIANCNAMWRCRTRVQIPATPLKIIHPLERLIMFNFANKSNTYNTINDASVSYFDSVSINHSDESIVISCYFLPEDDKQNVNDKLNNFAFLLNQLMLVPVIRGTIDYKNGISTCIMGYPPVWEQKVAEYLLSVLYTVEVDQPALDDPEYIYHVRDESPTPEEVDYFWYGYRNDWFIDDGVQDVEPGILHYLLTPTGVDALDSYQ